MPLKGMLHLCQAGRRGPRHLSASAAWRCQAELRRPKPGMRAWMAKHRACVEAASRLRRVASSCVAGKVSNRRPAANSIVKCSPNYC